MGLMNTSPKQTTVLCILDGWGYAPSGPANAISLAKTPIYDHLLKTYPWTLLETSGEAVGLPKGQMGNSEVGHLTLGAGRIPLQDLPKLNLAFSSGTFKSNLALASMIKDLKALGKRLHLMGLFSDGGVHAHMDHMLALTKYAVQEGVEVVVHPFLDGRDTLPTSATLFINRFLSKAPPKGWSFGTVMGRYYAMDRDHRWERTEAAYDAIVCGKGITLDSIDARDFDQSDEFVKPYVLGDYQGIQDGDGVFFTNFRVDRMRQLVSSIVLPTFKEFTRPCNPHLSHAMGMVTYDDTWAPFMDVLFLKEHLTETLGELVAKQGLKQLRLAETEKYAHVTYFFSGGYEAKFKGEDRLLIPSPSVATYDKCPEMSAQKITDALVQALTDMTYDLIVVNYANADMVGHSGNEAATIQAIEVLDSCLGRLVDAIELTNSQLIITADHGNAEMLIDPETHGMHTAHTLNAVPLICVTPKRSGTLKKGGLSDVAPTVLDLMGIAQPGVMTGHSLWI